MRSNYQAMCTRLERRAKAKVSANGKVWSEELETYLTPAQAITSGHGKVRRTKKEQAEYDQLLLFTVNQKAGKAIRKVKVNTKTDRELLLNDLVEMQERMTKGIKLANEAKNKKIALQGKLDRAKAGDYLPRPEFLAIVKAIGDWKDREKAIWNAWWNLQALSCGFAQRHALWADFFTLAAYQPTIWSAGERKDFGESFDQSSWNRTAKDNQTIEILMDSHLREQDAILTK